MKTSTVSIGKELSDCIQQLRFTLERRIQLIDAVIAVLVQHVSAKHIRPEDTPISEEIRGALPLMLQAIGASSNTLVQLSDSPGLQTRDCYSIARSIIELAINICYLTAEGPAAAERALRHACQKSFQDLERESKIGENTIRLVCGGRPDPDTVPGLKEDLAEFTSRAGREKGWVDESVDGRISVAGARFGNPLVTKLHFARFMVYRHSSEILHGTLFSAMYFFGLTMPRRQYTQQDAEEYIGQQHMMLLMAAGLALDAVVEAFHLAYGFQWAYDRGKKLTESLARIPFLASNTKTDEDPGSPTQRGDV